MIIVCPECTTKFRVSTKRIPEPGAKVRCARCKHIFWAEKPAEDSQEINLDASTQITSTTTLESDQEKTASFESTVEEEPMVEEEPTVTPDIDFDYDQFREKDNLPKEQPFTFSGDSPDSKSINETEDQSVATDTESFSFGTSTEIPDNSVTTFSLEDEPTSSKDTQTTKKTEDTQGDSTLNNDSPSESPVAAPPAKPKGNALSSIIRILLLLILSILILAGVMLYMNGPEQLEQIIQQLTEQQINQSEGTGQIVLENLQGKFGNNKDAGEIFIIRGEAVNKYDEPRASIQVKGVIFDQNGKLLVQKTIFCGNSISDEELQNLPFSKLEELMGNQFGKSLSNMNVNNGQAIPFVIVFRDLPQSLSEFSVDVTASKPAKP